MTDNGLISAAIVTYRDGEKVLNAINSLENHTKRYPYTLYVIDNNSGDNTDELIKNKKITFIENGINEGFGAAHNKVLNENIGKYHFVINPDIVIENDVLSDTVDFMESHPEIAAVMPQILNSDGSIQYLPKEIPSFKNLFLGRISKKIRANYTWANKEINSVCEVDFISGCFFCIRGEIYKKLGGFDERYFMYLEDADLTLRAKKYGKTVINPELSVTHLWKRESAKKIKYLLIHTKSAIKFLLRKRELIK